MNVHSRHRGRFANVPQGLYHQTTLMAETGEASHRGDEILTHARQAFVEKGFDGASMQDLARAAGMSAGNFYRYFPSKAAIVEALIERDLADVEEHFRAIAASSDPLAALKAGLRETLTEKCEGDDTLWAEIAATAARKPEVAAILARMEQGITRRVSHVIGLVSGVSEADAELIYSTHSRLLFIVIHGVMCSRLPDTAQEGELIDLVMRTIEHVIDDALAQRKNH
jgi:AcrR family transcriptional regulator